MTIFFCRPTPHCHHLRSAQLISFPHDRSTCKTVTNDKRRTYLQKRKDKKDRRKTDKKCLLATSYRPVNSLAASGHRNRLSRAPASAPSPSSVSDRILGVSQTRRNPPRAVVFAVALRVPAPKISFLLSRPQRPQGDKRIAGVVV